MIYDIKELLKNFFRSRLLVLTCFILLMFSVILIRIFNLQVVHGNDYQENLTDIVDKTISIQAARGCIYDCNGKLLAYNKLSYNIAISDTGSYADTATKNEQLNAELAGICQMLLENGETISNSFAISLEDDGSYSFNVSDNSLNRFRADVFGHSKTADLEYNETYQIDEANATPDQIMQYLMDEKQYSVSSSYSKEIAYYIVTLRYSIAQNAYARYKTTVIAKDVSDTTVAYINEHSDTLTGVSVEDDYIRCYNDSVYFASLIGYTGTISTEEYTSLSAENSSYTTNDTVGKTGLEQYYESTLRGTNGEKEVYINNVGKITQVISNTDPIAGNDIYLSIDSDLQIATYKLLEQEIASIVYSHIKDNTIPIEDVYFALIDNNVIDINHFSSEDASPQEQNVYSAFAASESNVINEISSELTSSPVSLNDMSDIVLDYFTYIISMLKDNGLLLTSEIDTSDSTYLDWKAGSISPKKYLSYCVSKQWIDCSMLESDKKYADTEELYQALVDYIIKEISNDTEFSKLIYEYLLNNGSISGRQLCLILLDQGIVEDSGSDYSALSSGTLSPSDYLLEKIDSLEITPAQLALDPCTGSCVITDPDTGAIKALVSYPGYDNNRLSNGVDSDYYNSLRDDNSKPLWNYATQEKTAPGSTFKMVTSTAGLAEDVISTDSVIECTGKFLLVDNEPECWIYPKNHGFDNVSQALRDSCNCFFYTVGYGLSMIGTNNVFTDSVGIANLNKYASMYGLDRKTGVEISESTPELATQYPVMAAIGQSNNNLTTISLSRYVTAVASGNVYDYQLMSKVVDCDGNVLEESSSTSTDISSVLNGSQWNAIHSGMRMVCEELDSFAGCDIEVAGKTGTAQQVETRPNHALFVGYAPYSDPEVTIAVRISYGYSSHNAAYAARNILEYYFGEKSLDDLLSLNASGAGSSSSNSVGD